MTVTPIPNYIDELAEDRHEWTEALDAIEREYGESGVRDGLCRITP